MEVLLILDSGNQKGRETRLARGIYLVGRSRICQIRPKNRYVSRKHCAIIHRKREVLIQDLGSKTGTYINRVRIDPKVATILQDGDRIRVGKTKFRLTIVAQELVLCNDDESNEGSSNNDEFALESSEQGESENENEAVEANDISSVLRMLEEEDEEDDAESPDHFVAGTEFRLAPKGVDIDADDDDDSDDNVVFAAPKSGDSIGIADPLPSYASRKDWDVKSVYSWIEQKETFAKLDARRARRIAKARIQNEDAESVPEAIVQESVTDTAEVYTPQQREAQARAAASKAGAQVKQQNWIDKLDSDSARPIVLIVVGVGFAAWIAWNAWLLISFKG